jgi:hypothetical protein
VRKESSTIFLHAVIVAVADARGQALFLNPPCAKHAVSVAAGGRATIFKAGVAVVTAAGRAVGAHTAVRAAGIATCAIATAAEVLAAGLVDLGFALVASELEAALIPALFGNHGSAVGIAQRSTVAA